MNNTLLVKGKGFSVGLLFAIVAMKLPESATHTSIKPKWWHRTVRHELRMQNVTAEEMVVIKTEFVKISPDMTYEIF